MRIGEFAQLGQVSVRMLRHYESMDLLAPDSVDPFTGHRSYTVAQLPRSWPKSNFGWHSSKGLL